MTLTLDIPTLETERLVLRPNRAEDFEAYARFYEGERSVHRGGPLNRLMAWRYFTHEIGHWAIRGYGFFAMEEKATGAYCGQVGPYYPEGWVEPEIGWLLMDGFEGRGLATEGALRTRAWAYGTLGWTTAISLIRVANTASRRLAERLGATLEREIEYSGIAAVVYRHPGPETLQ